VHPATGFLYALWHAAALIDRDNFDRSERLKRESET
jgi:hypothetical protein